MLKKFMVTSLAIILALCSSLGMTGFAAGETVENLTWDVVSNGQLQGFVKENLTVPTGWTLDSSDETVIRNNGKVTQALEDKGATLTFTSGNKSVSFDVVVPSFADAESKESLLANGKFAETASGFVLEQHTEENGYTYTVATPLNGKYRENKVNQNYLGNTASEELVKVYDESNSKTYLAYNQTPTSVEVAGNFRFAVEKYSDATILAVPVITKTDEGVEKIVVDNTRIEAGKTAADYKFVVNNLPSYTQPSASNITFINETAYASTVSTAGIRFKEMTTDTGTASRHYGIAKFIFKVGKASSSGWNQFDFTFRDVAQASNGGLQLTTAVNVLNAEGQTVAKSANFAYVGDPAGPDCITDVAELQHSASNPVVIGAWHELVFDVNAEQGYFRVFFDGKLAYWQYKNGEATEYSSKIALTDVSGKTYLSTGWAKGEQWVNEPWAFASIVSANSTPINYTKKVIANAMPYLPETPVKSDVLLPSYPNVVYYRTNGTINGNLWTPALTLGWDSTETTIRAEGTYNTDQTTGHNHTAKIQDKTPVTIEKIVLKKDGKQVYGISDGVSLESVSIDAGTTSNYSVYAARYNSALALEDIKKLNFTDGVATLSGFTFSDGDTYKIFSLDFSKLEPLSYAFEASDSAIDDCSMFVIGDGVAKDSASLLGNNFNGVTIDSSEALVGGTAESALRIGSLKYVTDNGKAGDYALIFLANSINYDSTDNFDVLLRTMVDSISYKGLTPIVVSPLVAEYATIAQTVADECGVPYINLSSTNVTVTDGRLSADDAAVLANALTASIKASGLPVAASIVAE